MGRGALTMAAPEGWELVEAGEIDAPPEGWELVEAGEEEV
jgi:hypothetical protein